MAQTCGNIARMSIHASKKQKKRLAACFRDQALREAGHATVVGFLGIAVADVSATGTVYAENLTDPLAIAAVAWGGFAIAYWKLGYSLNPKGVPALLERFQGAKDHDIYLLTRVRDRFGDIPIQRGLSLAEKAIYARWDTMEALASEFRAELSRKNV